jgi:hypothetical protein
MLHHLPYEGQALVILQIVLLSYVRGVVLNEVLQLGRVIEDKHIVLNGN